MGDRNPRKKPKKSRISLKEPFVPAQSVGEIKPAPRGPRKPGHK